MEKDLLKDKHLETIALEAKAIKEENSNVIRIIDSFLMGIPDAKIDSITKTFKDDDGWVLREKQDLLGNLKYAITLEVFFRLLKKHRKEFETAGLEVLEEIKEVKAVNYLNHCLQAKCQNGKSSAIDAMSDMVNSRTIDALTKALKDDSQEIRLKAADALIAFRSEDTGEFIYPLSGYYDNDLDSTVAHIIGRLGTIKGLSPS